MKKLLLIPALALAACSPQPDAPGEAKVTATDAWCRPAATGAPTGACYLTLTASSDDRLTAVESPAGERVEVHTMDMTGGIMRMREMPDGVELAKQEATELKPGGRHLMLIGPKAELAIGDEVPLVLTFEKAPALTLKAEVRQPPLPTGKAASKHDH